MTSPVQGIAPDTRFWWDLRPLSSLQCLKARRPAHSDAIICMILLVILASAASTAEENLRAVRYIPDAPGIIH
jgi:hypothetical protein